METEQEHKKHIQHTQQTDTNKHTKTTSDTRLKKNDQHNNKEYKAQKHRNGKKRQITDMEKHIKDMKQIRKINIKA